MIILEIIQISCAEFLPLPEHYRECEGSQASCVSTLGSFDRALVETKECGPWPGPGPGELCHTRVLGGGARVTVCHCRDNFCNKYSVQVRSHFSVRSHLTLLLVSRTHCRDTPGGQISGISSISTCDVI